MAKIILERKEGDYGFKVEDEKGHILQTDSSIENGGVDFGFRPMQLLLASLGSCSAIDMISILKKQKQVIKNFKIEIVGERETDVVPALWKNVSVSFYLNGNIETEKAEKAARLSIEKYCSVAETLRRGGTSITWNTKVDK